MCYEVVGELDLFCYRICFNSIVEKRVVVFMLLLGLWGCWWLIDYF